MAEGQWSDDLSGAWEKHRERLYEFQRHVSEWLVDAVDPQPGQTVLELAAGPGETGFVVAERVGPTGRVMSTDLGPGMVDAARRGALARGLENVECRVLDAQSIDLDDDSVDGVLSRFGLMLMPRPDLALDGVRRVLRPGRPVAMAVWGDPGRNPWLSNLAFAVLGAGFEPPGNPMAAGGVFSLADAERLRGLFEAAGFLDVEVVELPGVKPYADVDDYWDFQTSVSGGIATFISSLPPDDVAKVREALGPLIAEYATEDGFELPTLALGVRAVNP